MPAWIAQFWNDPATLAVLMPLLRVLLVLLVAVPLLVLGVRHLRRILLRRSTAQAAMLASKLLHYGGIIAILATVLHELGFNLTAVIGAAGVMGIAIGFASQTALSNVISGAFLISEKPFTVGEVIQVNDITGTVLSVDLMSVKVRTLDNRFVRIPNETLIKGIITTINRYPIRRLDLRLSVAYKEDVARVRAILTEIADRNPLCLDEPKPLIVFENFGASGLDFLFAVWGSREQFLDLRNSMMDQIKARFDAEGIEIPFPHLSIYAGSASEPLPIRVIQEPAAGA